jgi:hypothetical protein
MALTTYERTVNIPQETRVVHIESIGNSYTRTVYVE